MRGKKPAPKRKIIPDPRYNNLVIAKLINYVMERGKKSVARTIVYKALDELREKTKKDPLEIFQKAMDNIGPDVELRSRRIGGSIYQIPVSVNESRRFALACRWLIQAASDKKGKPMWQKIASELLDALDNQGAAIKKKQDVYKMAQANRAFAHFAR